MTTSQIDRQIEEARSRLLDLTLRNRLINFKPSSRRSMRILSSDPAAIYDHLVLEESALAFLPRQEEHSAETDPAGEAGENKIDEEVESKPTRSQKSLQTELSEEALPKQLFRISNEANSVLEEQGYTVLFLALGFLEWLESPSSETSRLAPLVLVPVELVRTKVREAYRLKWTGEDVGTNLSLQERLVEAGVALPDFVIPEEAGGLRSYYEAVSQSVEGRSGWAVKDDVYLGFFSFTKFVMYKDLDPAGWPEDDGPSSHPLIRALFSPGHDQQPGEFFPEEEVDERLSWSSIYHVMDADPSQIAAIEDIKAGLNLVVEGPPGTGKSQTIANMVGELLVHGKTVLFVSEKMAALEVVKQRLDKVGLGDFCLELHSRKSRKRDVLAELEMCLGRHETQRRVSSSNERKALVEHIEKLNEYVRDLRTPFGHLQFSPYQLYGMKEEAILHFSESGREMPSFGIDDDGDWTIERLSRVSQDLGDLADLLREVGPPRDHPWQACHPASMLPHEIEELSGRLQETLGTLQRIKLLGRELSEQLGATPVDSLQAVYHERACMELLQKSLQLPAAGVLSLTRTAPDESSIKRVAQLVENLRKQKDELDKLFANEAFDVDVDTLLTRMREVRRGLIPILNRDYRAWTRDVASLYSSPPSLFHRAYEDELTSLAQYQTGRRELSELDSDCRLHFGNLWRGEGSDVQQLRQASAWVEEFCRLLADGICSEELAHRAEQGIEGHAALFLKVQELEDLSTQADSSLSDLFSELRFDPVAALGSLPNTADLQEMLELLQRWSQNSHKLPLWTRYQGLKRSEDLLPVHELVQLIEDQVVEKRDIESCLRHAIAEKELRRAFAERKSLADFVGTLHNGLVSRFRKLDKEVIEASQREVYQKLVDRRPHLFGGVARDSEAGILQQELRKKKRHMPIRKLMEQAGGLIQKVKPCFMMSPLSIAQFLGPRCTRFDVIIFDEASQVRPQDALGALLRGRQLVVMGDTKQLPPTSFFDHLVEDTDEEEDEPANPLEGIESILDLCGTSFPLRTLKWHYRSRHESLIAVSNSEFYDNRLVVYPSPVQNDPHLGLRFVHLPNTVYDRGRTSENRQEAVAVAKEAIQHYKTHPHLSLGVGAFSTKQQNAILEEVQRELEEHPEMEGHFSSGRDEHFFVKNLETIQGDERDVIFLSVGYGFDRFGKLSRNFGPLHDGGERRLNVLITRARYQCVVFSNFRSDDLAIDAHAPKGVRALKTFLRFAETGELEDIQLELRDTDSPFEDAVRDFLRTEGFQVEQQVGCADYRIDLAVVDPKTPGRFLLGIECDGAQYHSSRVARERDRLRQQILEGLGWRLYRVWSTDWYTQRRIAQESLLRAVHEAIRTPPPTDDDLPSSSMDERSERAIGHAGSRQRGTADAPAQAVTDENNAIATEIPTQPYVECERLMISMQNDIHNTPRRTLAEAVASIVAVEAPVHVDEVIRRIRTLWGLKRSGKLIREAITRGIRLANSSDDFPVCLKGSFLWNDDQLECEPRCRQEREPLKIELISDEEIGASILRTLELQFASRREAIPTTAARLLGFHQTSEQIRSRIDRVLDEMIKQGRIRLKDNAMLDRATRE